ncbi:MAG TPA: pitrilysin family protein [Candidatus Limnocylindrales bacterium]|nr:pitrilysin family protein [Candidatus Limnocylindrales bacterium]
MSGLGILDRRPEPGAPREYRFPGFRRDRLENGLTVISAHLEGRPLLMAQIVVEGGAGNEPAEQAGVTALAARALTEGTRRLDAIELIEASERLGAEIHAEAGWETFNASVEVPRRHFGPALALLAETILEPAFPAREVERLRDERLYDLMQAKAEPRRRAEMAFQEAIYAAGSPFSRPLAGGQESVAGLGREAVVERHARLLDPSAATLIVAGDLSGLPVLELAREHLGAWQAHASATRRTPLDASARDDAGRIVLVDRPGSAQSELRVGHVGLPRRIPDYHAVTVMSALLGGLFNSRLQRLLREERGYTYGIGAGFEFRRAAGPFAVRTAVQTEVTAPALADILGELRRISAEAPTESEVREARDYLVGVFPLRFEAAAQVVAAITSLVVFELPDDELDRYRPAIAAVTPHDVLTAGRHVRGDPTIVIVGDAARVEPELRAAGLGPLEVVSEPLEVAGAEAEAAAELGDPDAIDRGRG